MILEDLERELLENSTRKNAERIDQLLADEFREFGSSGKVYNKSEIITLLQAEVLTSLSLADFRTDFITSEIALVTYKVTKHLPDGSAIESLRSSIWTFQSGQWQIIFHQGTKI